ncbi:zinc dependent phospholipase C family protein [Streptomyces sp. NPDC059828]|uniref:zinc dependent phospholipase C family protein n=1 Tax=Streptomyces sp. NPDC059828 TaxID=3346965 RepID=UPI00365EE9EE
MPGLYAHMDVARKALSDLSSNKGAEALFAEDGPSAAALEAIAKAHPAYTALGAIGPDMFFLLPDFKKGAAEGLWGAAQTIKDLYTWWDDNFLEPWEETLGPIAMNNADTLGALTGGVTTQTGEIASRAISYLITFVENLVIRQFDAFGLLSSGVQAGCDEQTFMWSDMFHYRKTFEFGHHLFRTAQKDGDEAHMAFALGWMSHLATDVTGHAFTNEKCGGPYRLHWQRHHLVENHMDARLIDSERGDRDHYNMLNNSAQHLWIAFHGDGTSRHDFFRDQPGPSYQRGDTTQDILDRASKWDVDSDLPPELARFFAKAAREFFTEENLNADPDSPSAGASAAHPTILEDLDPGSGGYADPEALTTTYWWLYKYLKWTTTDYYKTRRPEFDVIEVPPFPSPPGSGTGSPGPGDDDASVWQDGLKLLLAILAWLLYIAQVINWAATALTSIVTTFHTAPVRYLVYEYIEVPLYNAWSALHWYLSFTGFALPTKSETSPGLMTLGVAPQDAWEQLTEALDDVGGGLLTMDAAPPADAELSGRDEAVPREVVTDPPGRVPESAVLMQGLIGPGSPGGVIPSEFLRPWLYPSANQDGSTVRTEPSDQGERTLLGPYTPGDDATVLTADRPGSAAARKSFESARNEKDTLRHQQRHLPKGETLGGPVDFTGYVVAKLTRDDPGTITNFNLDSDRGYAYLCWDWVRQANSKAAPKPYQDEADLSRSAHQYHPPVAPGYGWDAADVISGPVPNEHDPRAPKPVRIRYIDREQKFA